MRLMAIDPGLKGGLVLAVDGQPIHQWPMPLTRLGKAKKQVVDLGQLQTLLSTYQVELVLIERQWRDGMCNQCKLEALVQLMGRPYEIISPRSWQTIIPEDIKKAFKDTKQRAIETCHRLSLPVMPTGSDRGYHDGLADAWCILAYYHSKMEKTKK